MLTLLTSLSLDLIMLMVSAKKTQKSIVGIYKIEILEWSHNYFNGTFQQVHIYELLNKNGVLLWICLHLYTSTMKYFDLFKRLGSFT